MGRELFRGRGVGRSIAESLLPFSVCHPAGAQGSCPDQNPVSESVLGAVHPCRAALTYTLGEEDRVHPDILQLHCPRWAQGTAESLKHHSPLGES